MSPRSCGAAYYFKRNFKTRLLLKSVYGQLVEHPESVNFREKICYSVAFKWWVNQYDKNGKE